MDNLDKAIAEVTAFHREKDQDEFIDNNKNCLKLIADLWRGLCDFNDIQGIHSEGNTLILTFKDGRTETF